MWNTKSEAIAQARELFMAGHHCSEAIVIAMGNHLWGQTPELLIKVACPFAGGIGRSRVEACGALSGATIILGALQGRTSASENDTAFLARVAEYRQRFAATQGGLTTCQPIKDYYPATKTDGKACWPAVEAAARLLLDMLEPES